MSGALSVLPESQGQEASCLTCFVCLTEFVMNGSEIVVVVVGKVPTPQRGHAVLAGGPLWVYNNVSQNHSLRTR